MCNKCVHAHMRERIPKLSGTIRAGVPGKLRLSLILEGCPGQGQCMFQGEGPACEKAKGGARHGGSPV
jgi:hypothetical protein